MGPEREGITFSFRGGEGEWRTEENKHPDDKLMDRHVAMNM